MFKPAFLILFVFIFSGIKAQLANVEYYFSGAGDCIFGATSEMKTPIFLNIDFEYINNSTFNEPLPYVKELEPGYNSLFTLNPNTRLSGISFNFHIKTFRSNPLADVNLDFPYLLPFAPGTKATVFDVKNIDGFLGMSTPKSWRATGFMVKPGEPVYAVRTGTVVEIAGREKSENTRSWYNGWGNSITLLQPDGTLICYKNVVDPLNKLKLNQKVFAGEILGEVAPGTSELVLLIYHNTLLSDDFSFIIPQFQIGPGKIGMVTPSMPVEVIHPVEIRGLEMTKKEQKRLLKTK